MKKLIFTVCILVLFLFSVPLSAVCPPGDLTEDCRVDLADFAIFATHWLDEETPDPLSYISPVADSPHRSTIGIPNRTVLYEDLFDSNTAFTVVEYGTASADTINYMVSQDATPRATQLLSDTSANLYPKIRTAAEGFAPKDWSNMSFGLRYYIADKTNITRITLQFASSLDSSNSRVFMVWAAAGRQAKTGWIDYTSTMSAGGFTDTGTYDPKNIVRMSITVTKTAASPAVAVTFDYFRVWDGRLKTPLYICTFDDMHAGQYAAAAYAMSKGVPVTIFVCGKWSQEGKNVSGAPGLTLEQLKTLREAGHLIANHTWSHSTEWKNWSASTDLDFLESEIEQNTAWMIENGFGDGARIFGAPNEAIGTGFDRRFRKFYDINRFGYGMAQSGGDTHASGLTAIWDTMSEIRSCTDTNVARADLALAANVGTAANNYMDGDKAIQITVFHYLDGTVGTETLAQFKAHIDAVAAHVAAGRLRAVTLADLLQPMEAMGGN